MDDTLSLDLQQTDFGSIVEPELERLNKKIDDEESARKDEDRLIWAEINTIEIASDVVDIVGTYAALQAYDTSKLQDNDIIKVLKDETHGNATTYYRWGKAASQFTYIGEEGPYYTTSQTDTLLAGKQDALTAGSNIQISNNVISATDTTYTAGTGISITDGVISSTAKGGAVLYFRNESNLYKFYRDSGYTDLVTYTEMVQMLEDGNVQLVDNPIGRQEMIYTVVFHTTAAQGQAEALDFLVYGGDHYYTFDWYDTDAGAHRFMTYTQNRLTAGSNITITNGGTVISATDTTYSNFTGATSQDAGTSGLVPAPAAGDEGKFLQGNGTWATVSTGTQYTAGNGINIDANNEISIDTSVVAEVADIPTVNDATLTVTQNGTTAGTFTANSSTNTTIALTDTTYSAFTGTDGQTAGTAGLVPAPATTDAGKFLKADGTWGTAGGATNNINSTDWNALWQ